MMSSTRSAVTTSARNVAGHRGPPKDSLRERLGGMERAFTPNQWPEGAYGNAEWSQRALSPHVEVSNTQDDVTT